MASEISTQRLKERNKIMAKVIDQYLGSNKISNISGLHLFVEDDAHSSHNIQKRSVIFVANKDIARKNGVHFTIPGTLMNPICVNSQENKHKLEFTADTIIKPMTLVVGEYTLHIDISCKFPVHNIAYKTVSTQTTTETVNDIPSKTNYSHTVSKSNISSIISELDVTQPKTVNINSQAELDPFGDTHKSSRKEISVEQMTEGEFARLFNPMSFSKKSQSITTTKDEEEIAFYNDKFSFGLRCEDENKVNQTGSQSEHSNKSFDTHIDLGRHNNSKHSISQSLLSDEVQTNFFENYGQNIAINNNNNFVQDSNKLFISNESSKSEVKQFLETSSCKCTQECVSYESSFKNREEIITNQRDSSKTNRFEEQEINTNYHSSSIDLSVHEIKRQLINVASSLNHINSYVQKIEIISQKSSNNKNKLNSLINDISMIENNNKYRPGSDNLEDRKYFICTRSQESVYDHSESLYFIERPKPHHRDKFYESKNHQHYNARDLESSKIELNSNKINHTHPIIKNDYSIQSNIGLKLWKSESLKSFHVKYLDDKANKTRSREEVHKIKSRIRLNIDKSTEIIHYNDNYQGSLSTSTTIIHELKNKNHNAQTGIKLENSGKSFFQNDEIFDDKKSIINRMESKSKELTSFMFYNKSNPKDYNVGLKIKNKKKDKLTSWSSNLRKIFRNKEQLQFNVFGQRSPIHNVKKPTQQSSECSENTEILRFQGITDWIMTQFHKKSDACLSSKTLHIVPS